MHQVEENFTSKPLYRPRLALTLGDPAGIGPEVILKALAAPEVSKNCDVTVVGSQDLLVKTYTKLTLADNSEPLLNPEELSILDIETDVSHQDNIIIGQGNAVSGAASFRYMEAAISYTLADQFDGIVTGPIAKSAWKAAGHNYPGQTELLAEKSGSQRVGMLFVARSPHTGWLLRTLLATTHIPLSQVPQVLTPQLMTEKLDLLVECLEKDFGLTKARIAVAGLNPHSGEQGQLGNEEQDWLIPWIEQERKNRPNLQIDGPIPPDTMWVKPGQAWYGNSKMTTTDTSRHRQTQDTSAHPLQPEVQNVPDAYLALYHDQGLIPVKLMAFDRAVNTSIGLPFIRTSPDHGTAFDIAGKGIADATSMKAAIELAAFLVSERMKAVHNHMV
ncbi:4-hydroxythreonine-4-phosphate dehydrogenase PdxA [Scytonema sp. NUACC21]